MQIHSVRRTGLPLGVPILLQLRNARGISATPRRGCFGQNDQQFEVGDRGAAVGLVV